MKTKYEALTTLQKAVCDNVQEDFKNGNYEVSLEGDHYEVDGYVAGNVVIGGYAVRCSINEQNYICWHDDFMKPVVTAIPHLERKICAQVKRMISKDTEEWKKVRIAELEAELKQLKGE